MTTLTAPGLTARGSTKPAPDPRRGATKPSSMDGVPQAKASSSTSSPSSPRSPSPRPSHWPGGWGLSWLDIALAVGFYLLSGLGVTVGFHRYFTHRAFQANRGLRNGLRSPAAWRCKGDVITWVADHRRHRAFADKEGDPHSPWLYGETAAALAKGFFRAHLGRLFGRDRSNATRFTPDLLADPDLARISRFPLWTVLSLLAPALLGGLITMSFWGALTAFFWAGLVRVAVLHHITWSINSICHMIGERPFAAQGKATNVWPLAIASMGESWHNLHHADPTCAQHGVCPGQIDMSADPPATRGPPPSRRLAPAICALPPTTPTGVPAPRDHRHRT